MESYFQQHHYHLNDHHTAGPRQMNSGLTRYQSAPSSYFSSFTDRESLEEFLHRPTSPETEQILSRFLQTTDGSNNVDSFLHQSFFRQNSSNSLLEKKPREVKTEQEMNFPPPLPPPPPPPGAMEEDEESAMHLKTVGDVTSASQNLSQNQKQQEIIGRSSNRNSATTLTRHNSSPAGLFSSIDVESAYASVMKNMGELGSGNSMNASNKEASSLTPRSRLPPSSSRPMSSISETDIKPSFSPGLPPRTLSGGLKRSLGHDGSEFSKRTGISRTLSGGINVPKTKEADSGGWTPLAHHLSLPKSLSDMEKLLSDSVPCKIRAKRGCATHPRSIAERVRRTKISERMKRLQDLVPNMDKQTNTADMLDLAVHYIKDLQGRVKALDEGCARCKCSSSRLR